MTSRTCGNSPRMGDAEALRTLTRLGLMLGVAPPPPMGRGAASGPLQISAEQQATLEEAGMLTDVVSSAGASTQAAAAGVVNTAEGGDLAEAAAAAEAAADPGGVPTPDEFAQEHRRCTIIRFVKRWLSSSSSNNFLARRGLYRCL